MDPPELVLATHPEAARLVRERAAVLRALRAHLDLQGSLEADIPLVLPAAGSEPHLHPPRVTLQGFARPLWLQTSPELPLKHLLCAGVERVYALGPAFRGGREELSPTHQPQFTMLEWYRPGSHEVDLVEDVIDLTAVVAGALELPAPGAGPVLDVASFCLETCGLDLEPLLDGETRAFARHARQAGLERCRDGDDTITLFSRVVVERLEPALATLEGLVFLKGFPACVAALARLDREDERKAARLEAYLGGVELANGYLELMDAELVRARWRDDLRGRAEDPAGPPPDERLLDALAHGPSTSFVGMALGLDRLVMALTGRGSIRDTRALVLELPQGE